MAPGLLGHAGVGVHAQHPAAGPLELPGGGAGADAHVEHVGAGAGGDDPGHQGLGIAGPGAVVALGVGPERLGDAPQAVGLGVG